jgi:hypothetical protein
MREKIIGGERRLRSEELQNMCSSPNTVGMIRSRKIRWAVHATRTEEKRNVNEVGQTGRKRPF